MEQQPGSRDLQKKLQPFIRDRRTRADASTRLGNINDFDIVSDSVEWALATVRYAWESESGRGADSSRSEAVRLLVRAGFEIAEGIWESAIDDRAPVVMALNRLVAEISDKTAASSVDGVAAQKYIDDELSWKEASERLRNRARQAPPGHMVDWYTSLRSSDAKKGWFHEPAHGGSVLAARFRGEGRQLFGPWPDFKSGTEIIFEAATTVIRWCEVAVVSMDNAARTGNNTRRRTRIEAAMWLEELGSTVARAALVAIGQPRDE